MIGVHAPWQLDRKALDADGLEALRRFTGGGFTRFVGIEREPDAFDSGVADGIEQFGGEVLGAEGAGRGIHPVFHEGQGVEDAFGEDDFAACQGGGVEGPGQRSRQQQQEGDAAEGEGQGHHRGSVQKNGEETENVEQERHGSPTARQR